MVAPEMVQYGEGTEQHLLVYRPEAEPCRLAILVHGGFWKAKYSVRNALTGELAQALVGRGWHVIDVEYRRVGHEGGGWPGSNEDVLAALAYIRANLANLVPGSTSTIRSALFGHSAGGQLAIWAAHHAASASGSAALPAICSARPEMNELARRALVPDLVVAIAPIVDLVAAAHARLSDEGDAVQRYLGGDPEQDDAARLDALQASPVEACVPCRVATLLVAGGADVDVPASHVMRFAHMHTQPNSPVYPMDIADADHYSLVDGESAACLAMCGRAEALLATRPLGAAEMRPS